MRIVVDLQIAQISNNKKNTSSFCISLIKEIIKHATTDEILLALNLSLPEKIIEIRAEFEDLIPSENICVWDMPFIKNDIDEIDKKIQEKFREAFIASLNPDIVLVNNLFEGFDNQAITSIGVQEPNLLTSVLLYSPIVFNFSNDLNKEKWYQEKLDHLRRANLCITFSEEVTRSIHLLGFSGNSVATIKSLDTTHAARKILTYLKETCHQNQKKSVILSPEQTTKRLRLAYISPLLSAKKRTADNSSTILSALSQHYEVDIISVQTPSENTWAEQFNCKQQTVSCFKKNRRQYDRILYQIEDSPSYDYMLMLLKEQPGLVVLQDFFLSHTISCMETTDMLPSNFKMLIFSILKTMGFSKGGSITPYSWSKELYHSHGYHALQQRFLTKNIQDIVHKFPCNVSVLQNALGIIVHSKDLISLAKKWYGDNCTEYWEKILPLKKSAYKSQNNDYLHDMSNKYYCTIENFYQGNALARQRLIDSLANDQTLFNKTQNLLALATSISFNHKPHPKIKQIFIDVSILKQTNAKTGIQRVVRGVLKKLIAICNNQFRVEPVYASEKHGFLYARRFSLDFINCPKNILDDTPIEPTSGDIFLGLDLNLNIITLHQESIWKLQKIGVNIFFVLYDLIPISHPSYFPSDIQTSFPQWLNIVSRSNGVFCISRAVAEALKEWVTQQKNKHHINFRIGYFHLGADIEETNITKGISRNQAYNIEKIQNKTNILMVGTIEPRKGYKQTLDAFEKLWKNGKTTNLVIAGKHGWMAENFISRLEKHPEKNKRLFWFQGISDAGLLKLYDLADGVLVASEAEGFGLPLIEAAKHKRPILARDIPVFREVAGEYARYFPDNQNADTLAISLDHWLTELANKTAPRSDNMPYFTWAESTQQLLSLILEKNSSNLLYKL